MTTLPPVIEYLPKSDLGKRKSVFDGKRIRAAAFPLVGHSFAALENIQHWLAILQYLCNAAHERAMGKDIEIGRSFDWMERFLIIAASKGFPEMPITLADARMWGMLSVEDAEAFSEDGFIMTLNNVRRSIIDSLINLLSSTYDEVFARNPDPDFKWRVSVRTHGNVWELKYPARYMAIQWMMAVVHERLQRVESRMDGLDSRHIADEPNVDKNTYAKQLKLIREAYSKVEACYAEWVEFLRDSGLLGKYYSPEIEGIVEAPQERRPPPLLEH